MESVFSIIQVFSGVEEDLKTDLLRLAVNELWRRWGAESIKHQTLNYIRKGRRAEKPKSRKSRKSRKAEKPKTKEKKKNRGATEVGTARQKVVSPWHRVCFRLSAVTPWLDSANSQSSQLRAFRAFSTFSIFLMFSCFHVVILHFGHFLTL